MSVDLVVDVEAEYPVRAEVAVAGDASLPPLVLLHDGAWGGSGLVTWSEVVPLLQDSYRVIVPDLPGFGRTSKFVDFEGSPYSYRSRFLMSVLDALDVPGPVHIVGSSFGGSLGLHALASYPARIRSVMSISGTGGPWRSAQGKRILSQWDGTAAGLRPVVAALAGDSAGWDMEGHLKSRYQSADSKAHVRSLMAAGTPVPTGMTSSTAAVDSWPRALAGSQAPVCLVHGERDRLVEPLWFENFRPVVRNLTVITHGGFHSPNLYDPRWTAELVREWLTTQGGVDSGGKSVG